MKLRGDTAVNPGIENGYDAHRIEIVIYVAHKVDCRWYTAVGMHPKLGPKTRTGPDSLLCLSSSSVCLFCGLVDKRVVEKKGFNLAI